MFDIQRRRCQNKNMLRFPISASTRYLVQETVLFILFSCVLVLSGTTAGWVNLPPMIVLAGVITLAALIWSIAGIKSYNFLTKPLLFWCAAYLVSMIFSDDPRRSFSQSIFMMIGIFLFWLVSDLVARKWAAELVSKVVLILGGLIIATGWIEAGFWYFNWLQTFPGEWFPDLLYRPASANVIAGFINVILLLAVSRLIHSSNLISKWMLGILILSGLPLVYLSSSRAGWLSLAAGFVVIFLTNTPYLKPFLANFWNKLNYFKPWKYLFFFLGFIIVIVLIWLLLRQATHPTHYGIVDSRKMYWEPAIKAFSSSPLIGTGSFTYANSYLKTNSVPPHFLFVHSHGTLFNLLAEMGIFGLIALGWIAYSCLVMLLHLLKSTSGLNFAVVTGTFASFVALGIHSIFDCFHTEPIALWSWIIVLGACSGLYSASFDQKKHPYPVWLLVVCLWAEIFMVTPLHQAVNQLDQDKVTEAIPILQTAIQLDPNSIIAHQQLGLAYARSDPLYKENLVNALREFDFVVNKEPHWGTNRLNKSAVYFALGDYRKAKIELEWLVKVVPRCAICYLNYGIAAENTKDHPTAANAYETFLNLTPDPSSAYFWRSNSFRSQIYQNWVSAHPEPDFTPAQLESDLLNNRQIVGSYTRLASYLIQQKEFQKAEYLLKRANFAYTEIFLDSLEKEWLMAEIKYQTGNEEQARQIAKSAIFRYQHQGIYGPGSFGLLYYAPLMFRRPASAAELIPQVHLFPITDKWAHRILILSDWYTRASLFEEASSLRGWIKQYSPDLLP